MKHLNTWFQCFLLYILVVFRAGAVGGLRLMELRVPSHAALGTRVHLACSWALSAADSLYSVKWYKDGSEFYRYVPSARPHHTTKFALPGVDVEAAGGSGGNITLAPLSLESAGRYRCEVSGEAPLFLTVSDHADMTVVALPEDGPTITGSRPRYQIGDRVRVTCTSGRSKPAARLSWFINGEPAPASSTAAVTTDAVAGMSSSPDGLETTSLVLDFKVKPKHFRKGDLKLKCLATIATVYWRSNEESVQGDRDRERDRLKGYTKTREVSLENSSRADRVLQQAAISNHPLGGGSYLHSAHTLTITIASVLVCITYHYTVIR